MTDHEIIGIIQTLHPDLKVGPMELIVGRAIADAERKQVAQVLIGSVRAEDAVRKAAAAAEREKVAKWMAQKGYATGHGDTVEDLLKELEWQILENWHRAMVNGVETEREACAKVCDLVASEIDDTNGTATYCAKAIRARGGKRG